MSFFGTFNARSNQSHTFKPKPSSNAKTQALREYAESTLGSGSLREAVKLPPDEDQNEWIAVHVVDFFNQVNLLYGTITEFCSPTSCPQMLATEEYEYLWQDSNDPQFKRPTQLSAPDYIEHLMTWIQGYFNNPLYFPAQNGVQFAPGTVSIFRNILRKMFRVYAHIYCHHFNDITELGLQPHLNTSLKHFVLFVREFDLVSQQEFGPLQELIAIMLKDDE